MPSLSSLYRKLCRLREKRRRLDARISRLAHKLQGKTARWGGCSYKRKRR